jgi:leucyl-tRNA synthetase
LSSRIKGSGKYIPKSSVNFDSGTKPVERESGLPVVVEWEKMSKSKHNGADPGVVIDTYGSDMTR